VSQAFRVAHGGRINRAQRVAFTFDGRSLEGYHGDTLASALLANGIHLVGRSFKYHRPRGILTAGSEEPNALVTIVRGGSRSTPNLRATQVELYAGLEAHSQNRWPSLTLDVGAINGAFARLLPAGFYYKTFMGPGRLGPLAWKHLYEPLIRRAAGLGRAPHGADPDRYATVFAHCDVLVVGAGPAGLAAALAASENGANVILCDEQMEMGGSLLSEPTASIEQKLAFVWLEDSLSELRTRGVRLLPRTQAFGYFADNFVALAQRLTDHMADPPDGAPRERLWQVRAKQVVIATGAIERPLVFSGNDRPGIMLADGARTFLARFGVKPGSRVAVFTRHDSAYRAALALHDAGLEIALIADLRDRADGELPNLARMAGIRVQTSAVPLGTRGRLRVQQMLLATSESASSMIHTDLVLMCGGWTPSVHLFSQSRGKLRYDERLEAFVPHQSVQDERSAGSCRGICGLAACLDDGYAAGQHAVGSNRGGGSQRFVVAGAPVAEASPASAARRNCGGSNSFVDFQNDVTVADLKLANREGFRSIEHLKRYTTIGMGTDQGKTSNLNALAIVADNLDQSMPNVGLTTFRMPYTPVTFGTLAGLSRGDLFDPVRRTPIHEWSAEHGAVFEDVGSWKRARYYPNASEDMAAAVARETRIVRERVGLFDASTLGKIEVVGPDSAEFLNRMYVNDFLKLQQGRCRYGILLNEAGFVIDDGVIGRLASDRFHVTTTTGGAARVLAQMEDYLQTEWPDLDVWLTSVTEQWAVIAVQGPQARSVIEPLISEIEISADALPHMSVRDCRICGIQGRLFRVSFTGELGFELSVPAGHGRFVWEAVWERIQEHAGCAYGTEAMHVLRAEKGYIIVGQETDGTQTPNDLGLASAINKSKLDFVGKRSLTRSDMLKSDRKQLVGLQVVTHHAPLEEGAQITALAEVRPGASALGHVTSAYASATLSSPIALALVSAGRARIGEILHVQMPGKAIAVRVVSPVFFDPQGERLNA
jgi:sarcosine oxidase subunit alpha